MPVAETIALISCICSVIGATKTALELSSTLRKLKHAENGRLVTPYAPPGSIVQQSNYDNQNARKGKNSLLLLLQWVIIEKAVWIIAYLAGALVSVSCLLASRSDYTRFSTFRKWESSIPSYDGRDSEVNYGTFGRPSWIVPETHLFASLARIWNILGSTAALILSIVAFLWPFTAAPLLGLFTNCLLLETFVPVAPEFLSGELARRLLKLLPSLGCGLVYREFVFGYLAHDAVVSVTCDTLLLGSVLFTMARRDESLRMIDVG